MMTLFVILYTGQTQDFADFLEKEEMNIMVRHEILFCTFVESHLALSECNQVHCSILGTRMSLNQMLF